MNGVPNPSRRDPETLIGIQPGKCGKVGPLLRPEQGLDGVMRSGAEVTIGAIAVA